jgi:hypothetical protein
MMRSHNYVFLLASLLLSRSTLASPSEVIFPEQRLPLVFSHAKHLAKKIECDFCHDKAPRSRHSSDDLIPTEEVCATCHPIDREHPERVARSATACSAYHARVTPPATVDPVVMPAPNLKFDHAAHAGRGIACTRCHARMDHVDLATRASLPSMALCLGCHDSGRGGLHAPSRCSTCHLTNPDNTLVTDLPTGTLTPSGALRGDAHTLDFRTHHAAVASDEKYCQSCHRQDFCLGCHNGVVKPMDFHGNDYISRHAIDARKDDPKCSGCHRAQSFCLGCHERLGVVDFHTGAAGLFSPIGSRTFHPAGWSDPVAAGQPNHHKWQAERNLRQCVACHRQETCLECHAKNSSSAGGAGKMWVNPHPPTWRNSDRCFAQVDRNVRVCLRCHPAGDPELSCR